MVSNVVDLSPYRMSRYQDGGRGDGIYDCWGWVREGLHKFYNKPLLASYGNCKPTDKVQMTKISKEIMPHFKSCDFVDGAVACVYIGKVFTHVGLVVMTEIGLKVTHFSSQFGFATDDKEHFESHAGGHVEYVKWRD